MKRDINLDILDSIYLDLDFYWSIK